jgi:uncharacterized membrane protein YeaQ/YmgE (transglycosylase-associated protein family)
LICCSAYCQTRYKQANIKEMPMRAAFQEERFMGVIVWLIVGAIAGWLAGIIVKGGGFGLIGNIVIGIIGAIVAGWVLPLFGVLIGGGFFAQVINAAIGAIIVLLVVAFIKRA